MASLLKRKSEKTGKTLWTVQVSLDKQGRRRPTIPLRNLTKAQATTAKGYIESLASSKRAGVPMDGPTADWLASIGSDLRGRLVALGLCEPPKQAEPEPQPLETTLGAFLAGYVAERDDVKPATRIVYGHTRRCLTDYFGTDRPLRTITAGDAKDWRRWLSRAKNEKNPAEGGQGLSDNTVRRRCSIAKQFLADAVDRELIVRNPFGTLEGLTVGANESRDYFVTRDETAAVINACPDAQWKLLFALSRYGGLRCPSEHLGLTWGDVEFERARIVVRSPKTAHHEGKDQRIVPLFPELLPYLQAVRDELEADPEFDPKPNPISKLPIITRYRDKNANLRTQLLRIIAKAKLTPWPKLFQNLRASRATELAAEFPAHVAAEWMGHSTVIADKHYWRVTDADFDRAICAAKTLRQSAETDESDGNGQNTDIENPLDVLISRVLNTCLVGDKGLEPLTFWV